MKAFLRSFIWLPTFAFITFITMAQTKFNYDTAWKKVETAFNEGKPKTAIEEIDKIYKQAKADKNEAQQVKSIIFKSQAVQMTEEDSWLKNIKVFEKEIKSAGEPVKQILYSVTAGLYQALFDRERWKIYDRTVTDNSDPANPETWSVEDFNQKISSYYEKSLVNPLLLQKTLLTKYDPIIIKGNMRALRPTLYDLLAHEALNYWKNDESQLTKPAYAFELKEMVSLAPSKMFIRYTFETKDSSSNLFKAITLYQELVRFHLNDATPDALIDIEVARVQFANENAVFEGKNQLYKEALDHIYTQYPKNEQAMQAGYLLANWWNEKGDAYNAATGTQTDKMAYAIAYDYASKVAAAFPKSEGGLQAKNLIQEIIRPSVGLKVEKANVPEKPFRALLSFKTTPTVYLRLVKLNADITKDSKEFENDNTYWAKIARLTPIRSWTQNVPTTKDYRSHSAEIRVDGLPHGRYLLIASGNAGFSVENNPLASAELYVSNISFVHSAEHYFVLNRDNGQPINAAKVQVWNSRYDYNKRANVMEKADLLTSSNNGLVTLPKKQARENTYNEVHLEISTGTDYLFMDESLPRAYHSAQEAYKIPGVWEDERAKYYFFTDRSIYRPGQSLFFKAIGLTADASSGNPKLYKPESVEVILRNANYEQVASQKYVPNEYASIQGNFLLPSGGLTGVFLLEIKKGDRTWQQSIRVEEYKRPKYMVEFTPLKGQYKLNNEVKISGLAKGYAGNMIDGASVAYRVSRSTRFLYPWYFGFGRGGYWPPQRDGGTMEITNGTTLTKADGTFDIIFTALPDLSVDKKLDPAFDYAIEAVVTDINGEVRSSETSISIGYKSLELSLSAGGELMRPSDSAITLNISTSNLNGQPDTTDVSLKIFALKDPGRMLRNRFWETPDTFVLSKAEFIKNFPNDPYENEDNYRNWDNGREIAASKITSNGTANYTIEKGKLDPGYYKVEATAKDKDGQEVKTIEFIAVFDPKTKQLPANTIEASYSEKVIVEPGEQAIVWQGTGADNPYIIQQTIKKGKGGMYANGIENTNFDYITPATGMQRYAFAATEADRGGYAVSRIMVYNNRVYNQSYTISVPWTNKDLSISYETFRDKLKPGDNETWTVKISGAKGEQIAAEMLAGMYDASLDQFAPHQWDAVNPWKPNNFYARWESAGNFSQANTRKRATFLKQDYFDKRYDHMLQAASNYDMVYSGGGRTKRTLMANQMAVSDMAPAPGTALSESVVGYAEMEKNMGGNIGVIIQSGTKDDGIISPEKPEKADFSGIQVRKNFNETALFFPDLKTDEKGNISFSFTIPEALTQWELQLLGHTRDARFAYSSRTAVTQKQLMVLPNAPRFLRQGDNMEMNVKISNLSPGELTGQAQLQMINPTTGQPVDGWFRNVFPNQYFTVAAGQSVSVKFPIEVPFLYNDAVMYRVVAKAGDIGDGEEMAIPVLTNRMLVTESFPLNLRGTDTKTFDWERFRKLNADPQKSTAFDNHSITVEYTTNPAWYAIQSLPYLMDYPYDCAEQTWNRFYANALAGKIANSSPRIKAVFEAWKNLTPDALLSNLQKNPELKSALLEETPWVLDAKNESEQKRNIGLLFDMVRMNNEAESALNKLQELQSSNGGFVWFKGGRDDRYMTQYILTGIGHLKKLDAWPEKQQQLLRSMAAKAIVYADARIKDEYDEIMKQKPVAGANYLSSFAIQYLYMRSFFPEQPVAEGSKKAVAYFTGQAKANWVKQGKYQQGMIALSLHRGKDLVTPKSILASLTENSISHEEFGMYWKEFNNPGWYWWQAPIESHSLLMEAYAEIENSDKRMDDLKTWLLKQKQTTNWKSTKATAEACYALLMRGTDWLSEERTVSIDLGGYKMNSSTAGAEAGTGYFKQVVPKEKITGNMGTITVKTETVQPSGKAPSSNTSWGSVYWQYFQDLDKITIAETSVAIKKELYVQKNSDRGPVLERLVEGATLKKGDRIKVRIEIMNDRNMEYVHIKDMRASCFEPVQVLSGYKWQGGLGYYETIKDASSNFFIGYLARGTYIFEYELRVTISGNFSNGITTLQCMYAPGFSTHSEGIRVNVDE